MMENVKVICLTGGPCGGKTSCLSILSDLFQSLGWKVFRVPETATILLRYTSKQLIDSGGVHFAELNDEMAYLFQKDLLKTMLQIEDTYIHLAQKWVMNGQKAVVICDR
jgi:thymidylate kinase